MTTLKNYSPEFPGNGKYDVTVRYIEDPAYGLFHPFFDVTPAARCAESALTGKRDLPCFTAAGADIFGITAGRFAAVKHFFNALCYGLPMNG